MTKEEYEDFVLRYKGCGACFPMYHTLSRFEKMWFTAIQKDVVDLEKENAELKDKLKPENCLKLLAKDGYVKFSSDQLTKAKEIIKQFLNDYPVITKELLDKLEQFVSEEKEKSKE